MFTYFQLINVCSPYKFADILMIEIMKLVEKVKFIAIKGFKGCLGEGIRQKMCLVCQDN